MQMQFIKYLPYLLISDASSTKFFKISFLPVTDRMPCDLILLDTIYQKVTPDAVSERVQSHTTNPYSRIQSHIWASHTSDPVYTRGSQVPSLGFTACQGGPQNSRRHFPYALQLTRKTLGKVQMTARQRGAPGRCGKSRAQELLFPDGCAQLSRRRNKSVFTELTLSMVAGELSVTGPEYLASHSALLQSSKLHKGWGFCQLSP